jgi:hypothetical protein
VVFAKFAVLFNLLTIYEAAKNFIRRGIAVLYGA